MVIEKRRRTLVPVQLRRPTDPLSCAVTIDATILPSPVIIAYVHASDRPTRSHTGARRDASTRTQVFQTR
jgi:hypothetical protein